MPTSGGYIVRPRTAKVATRSAAPVRAQISAVVPSVRRDCSSPRKAHVARVTRDPSGASKPRGAIAMGTVAEWSSTSAVELR